MIKSILLSLIWLFTLILGYSQNVPDKYVQANGIRLHYLDFGGEGLPLIFLQSFHDDASEWHTGEMKGITSEFVPDYKVLALTRRGWGKSDHTEWGYDVATQSEDLLAFMDALQIEKAVLIGRIPGNQDMIWIAEHHPERIAAMIMIGNPVMSHHSAIPEIRDYERENLAMSWDLGERAVDMRGPRSSWRPHFLDDTTHSIDIPALRFLSETDVESLPGGRQVFYLDRMIQMVTADDFEPWNDRVARAAEYFQELGRDSTRRENIRNYLLENDPGPTLRKGLERALGSNLKTVTEPSVPDDLDFDTFWAETWAPFFVKEIHTFLEGLSINR